MIKKSTVGFLRVGMGNSKQRTAIFVHSFAGGFVGGLCPPPTREQLQAGEFSEQVVAFWLWCCEILVKLMVGCTRNNFPSLVEGSQSINHSLSANVAPSHEPTAGQKRAVFSCSPCVHSALLTRVGRNAQNRILPTWGGVVAIP